MVWFVLNFTVSAEWMRFGYFPLIVGFKDISHYSVTVILSKQKRTTGIIL